MLSAPRRKVLIVGILVACGILLGIIVLLATDGPPPEALTLVEASRILESQGWQFSSEVPFSYPQGSRAVSYGKYLPPFSLRTTFWLRGPDTRITDMEFAVWGPQMVDREPADHKQKENTYRAYWEAIHQLLPVERSALSAVRDVDRARERGSKEYFLEEGAPRLESTVTTERGWRITLQRFSSHPVDDGEFTHTLLSAKRIE